MATQRCLLIVADYPYVDVKGRLFAEVPWDAALADLYRRRFNRILLLGRLRKQAAAPAGWVAIDDTRFTVIDGGDWRTVPEFVGNLPRFLGALRRVWDQTVVLHCKLFYLNSVAAWAFNRLRPPTARKPVATLLVGDAAEAILLRADLLPFDWMRRIAAEAVAWVIRTIQRRVEVPGFAARLLASKFAGSGSQTVVANESWLQEEQIHRHERPAPRAPSTVLFVGRLIARKRPRLLLESVARLVRDGSDLRCVLVGDGPDRPALEVLAGDLGLRERVRFAGWLGLLTPAMLAAYDDADILCLPSFAEGLPLVLIEAMGRGAAVVATAVSGTPEIVSHERTGLLVPRDDLDALTGAIRRYLVDPALWRRCVDGGYAIAGQHTFRVQRGRLADAIAALAP